MGTSNKKTPLEHVGNGIGCAIYLAAAIFFFICLCDMCQGCVNLGMGGQWR